MYAITTDDPEIRRALIEAIGIPPESIGPTLGATIAALYERQS